MGGESVSNKRCIQRKSSEGKKFFFRVESLPGGLPAGKIPESVSSANHRKQESGAFRNSFRYFEGSE